LEGIHRGKRSLQEIERIYVAINVSTAKDLSTITIVVRSTITVLIFAPTNKRGKTQRFTRRKKRNQMYR
jgi:hypothetical protein